MGLDRRPALFGAYKTDGVVGTTDNTNRRQGRRRYSSTGDLSPFKDNVRKGAHNGRLSLSPVVSIKMVGDEFRKDLFS